MYECFMDGIIIIILAVIVFVHIKDRIIIIFVQIKMMSGIAIVCKCEFGLI